MILPRRDTNCPSGPTVSRFVLSSCPSRRGDTSTSYFFWSSKNLCLNWYYFISAFTNSRGTISFIWIIFIGSLIDLIEVRLEWKSIQTEHSGKSSRICSSDRTLLPSRSETQRELSCLSLLALISPWSLTHTRQCCQGGTSDNVAEEGHQLLCLALKNAKLACKTFVVALEREREGERERQTQSERERE